jgi:triosephosphate isomerase
MMRKPFALSNWKMTMTIADSLAFVRQAERLGADLFQRVDVIVCPPFTALYTVAKALEESAMQLGGQDIAPTDEISRTGQISARLLADAGCRWVMLGHWEVRRYLGDDDEIVNRKVHLALEAGLRPILLIGEGRGEMGARERVLEERLAAVLADCEADQVANMAFVYEPEGSMGADKPATPDHLAEGCRIIRGWLQKKWENAVAPKVRIIYGGSVTPENAAALLAVEDVDGLGASRRGRDARTWLEIVRQIDRAKQDNQH